MLINKAPYGNPMYKVTLGTGLAWTKEFKVYANNEQEAIDLVADYIEVKEFYGLYSSHYELADLCEANQTVDEYAEANNLICCGNHGIYLEVLAVEKMKIVIYKDGGTYFATYESNHNARIKRFAETKMFEEFDNPSQIVDFHIQHFGYNPEDFIIIEEELK